MVDADDLLFDDRSLVQVGCHVMRRRAHQLDAAVVCLVVRLGALESGQERVVDVDRAALQRRARVVGQHLHVPRKNHQVGVHFINECEQLGFGLAACWWA